MRNSTKYKNYHAGDFKEILKLVDKKQYDNALILYEKYFEQYPKDYSGYILYIGLLIKLGKLDEALIKFNNINVSKIKDQQTIDSYIFNQIKLYSHLYDFQKAYDLLISNEDVFFRNDWGYIHPKIFFKKQLGILTEKDYKKDGYVISQIVDYSEDKLFEHLNKHIYSNECTSSCCFVENFPIKEVYFKIKELLSSSSKLNIGIINNRYLFKYEFNGRCDGKISDYIEVITLHSTNEIITIYPYNSNEKVECIDLTPSIEDELPKVKRKSQIDKFNQRYSKN